MKKLWILGLLSLVLTGCGASDAAYQQVTMEQAAEIMESQEDYILLDVRTQEEFAQGHIPGAICIPNETIGQTPPEQLPDKAQTILVYCRSGNRSKQASQKLAQMGYTQIIEFGGILSWPGETVTSPLP